MGTGRTVTIDLAKNVFQLHGVNEFGKPVLKKQLRRDQMAEFFVNLPACLIGMEACGSAHYWARKLQGFGHTVKLMAPQFVKPYVKTNKNDAADAEAICEAVARPNMRFVPIKNIEQQSVLALHRVRQGFVKARTAQANQIRGLLSEFGLIIPQGIGHIAKDVVKNNFPSSAIGRHGAVVPAGQMFIEDDAHVCQEVCRDFFAFDVDPAEHLGRHLQPAGRFGLCHELPGDLHRVKRHALAGARDMGKQAVLDRVVF